MRRAENILPFKSILAARLQPKTNSRATVSHVTHNRRVAHNNRQRSRGHEPQVGTFAQDSARHRTSGDDFFDRQPNERGQGSRPGEG